MKVLRSGLGLTSGVSVIAFSAGLAAPSAVLAQSCDVGDDPIGGIMECVTLEGVRSHQAAWQQIADTSTPYNRASGFEGYDRSVDYVVQELRAVGYDPVVQPFDFTLFSENSTPALSQTSPNAVDYVPGEDFATQSFSGSGSITANVTPVDLDLGPDNDSTSGCEIEDFAGFPEGNIALIQRGACTFRQKAENAEASGASGVIIFNQGNEAGRRPLFGGTLSEEYVGDLSVLSASTDLGEELAALADDGGVTVTLTTDTTRATFTTFNVLAETRFGDPGNVVMVGGHLDSVDEGPGIQDNGSGSAAVLETAIQMADLPTKNKVRFAWWGAEESGLVGATFYVDDAIRRFQEEGDQEIANIALYLNFDMIGSPNYVFKIYDGDDSDEFGAGPGPAGSAAIEAFFEDFYDSMGEPSKPTDFSGRSDYGPFIDVGIPSGGLFTGAEEIKTEEEEAIWGGTAGDQLDPCYHTLCDDFDNIDLYAFDVNSDAVAAATIYYALDTSEVNGPAAASIAAASFRSFASVQAFESGQMEGMDQLGTLFFR